MNNVLYLVRHTAVDVEEGICYGNTDVPLKDSFSDEQKIIAKKLEGQNFTQAYSSPLKRCVKLGDSLVKNLIFDPRLKEMNFGQWEGKSWEDIYSSPEGKEWFQDYLYNKCPQGESFQDLIKRVADFLKEIKKTEGPILIVNHAGVIRAALAILGLAELEEVFDIELDYGEIIKIENTEYTFL